VEKQLRLKREKALMEDQNRLDIKKSRATKEAANALLIDALAESEVSEHLKASGVQLVMNDKIERIIESYEEAIALC